jgi:hypothetical protein
MIKKNHIVKHYPSFCDMGKPKEAYFNTTEELLKIKWVKSFSDDPTFFKFALDEGTLMALYKGGKEWWVVGFVKYRKGIELPRVINYEGKKANLKE